MYLEKKYRALILKLTAIYMSCSLLYLSFSSLGHHYWANAQGRHDKHCSVVSRGEMNAARSADAVLLVHSFKIYDFGAPDLANKQRLINGSGNMETMMQDPCVSRERETVSSKMGKGQSLALTPLRGSGFKSGRMSARPPCTRHALAPDTRPFDLQTRFSDLRVVTTCSFERTRGRQRHAMCVIG